MRSRIFAASLATSALLSACSEGPAEPRISTGVLAVRIEATGVDVSETGYSIFVDSLERALHADGKSSLWYLSPGAHPIHLGALPFNCDWQGADPAPAPVRPADTVRITVQAQCHPFLEDAILYVGGNGNEGLRVVRADGTRKTVLPVSNGVTEPLSISPDGRMIAGVRYVLSDESEWLEDAGTYLVDAVTGTSTQLTHKAWVGGSSWSPDGRQLAISMQDPDDPPGTPSGTNPTIWILNRDGSGLRRLTERSTWGAHTLPSWSPDGKRILYQSGATFVVSADGTRDTLFALDCFNAQWSPNGQQVACVGAGPEGGPATLLRIMNADGGGDRVVVQSPDPLSMPSWSPDGTELVYTVSPEDAPAYVYRIRADGTGGRRVAEGQSAVWAHVH